MTKHVILDSGDIRSFKINKHWRWTPSGIVCYLLWWRGAFELPFRVIFASWSLVVLFRWDTLYPRDSLAWGYDCIQSALIIGSLAPPRRAQGFRAIIFAINIHYRGNPSHQYTISPSVICFCIPSNIVYWPYSSGLKTLSVFWPSLGSCSRLSPAHIWPRCQVIAIIGFDLRFPQDLISPTRSKRWDLQESEVKRS